MYKAVSERFFQQRAEANRKAVEAYRLQRKEELQNQIKEAMAAANIKSAEELKQEIEKALQAVNIPSIDRLRQEIEETLEAIQITMPVVDIPKAVITIPPFNFPTPPSFMPVKSLAERQAWAQTRLDAQGTVVLRGFSSAATPGRSPLSFAGHQSGSVTFASDEAAWLWQRVAEIRQALQQTIQPLPAAVTLTAIQAEETDVSTVIIAGEVLNLPAEAELRTAGDTVALSLTAQLVQHGTQLGIALVRHEQPVAVPVVHMSMWPDSDTGFYRYELTDDAGVRIPVFITPDKAPGAEPLSPEVPVIPETIIHTGNHSGSQPKPVIETLPPAGDTGYRELILIPPAASGLKPIYIMFNSPRDLPGEVTGSGQEVSGNWLDPASKEQGAPIPSQIADKLRWRTYSRFDRFREAFWIEVGNDAELVKQFNQQNMANFKKGKSPFVVKVDRAGGRKRFELHHVKPISEGGAVYDMDNIRVLTPKRHMEIHSKKRGNDNG